MVKEALFYEQKQEKLACYLCPHHCQLKSKEVGLCQVRENVDGRLISNNYGKITSMGLDPIEKKPLYHFYPGSDILSVGSFGCNFSCSFCQNYQISQEKAATRELSSDELIEIASQKNSIGIAYTYSEPLVWYEYVLETAQKASAAGLKNVLISNGYIEIKPLKKLLPHLDAANIDLKSGKNDFYRDYCRGNIDPVKRTIRIMAEKIHLEVTNLIITEANDDLLNLEEMFIFLADINPAIPLHLSRYHPAYKLNNPATDPVLMKKARNKALAYLEYVYLGNLIGKGYADTTCPACGELLIERTGYHINKQISTNKCPTCNKKIYGRY